MSFAVLRLEVISRAIHQSYASLGGPAPGQTSAYVHFRARAYRLLTHYVDHGLADAFQWSLMMSGAAPKKRRIRMHENAFHWGLLAMTSAAGTFMSPNKLRTLGALMKQAHAEGVAETELESFIRGQRKRERQQAMDEMLEAIKQRNAGDKPNCVHMRREQVTLGITGGTGHHVELDAR